jgi:esterase/lipase
MGFPKSMSIAMSGLVFGGGVALAVGAATPVGAAVVVAAAQNTMSRDGCCGHRNSRLNGRNFNVSHLQERLVLNNRIKIANTNKSDSDAQQGQRLENQTSPVTSSAAAAGGGGGGGGAGGTG